MMRHRSNRIFLFLLWLFSASANVVVGQSPSINAISSPDKRTACEIGVDKSGQLVYRVLFENKIAVDWSPLGLVVNSVAFGENTVVEKMAKRSFDEKFAWPLGEDDVIRNQYNELSLSCRSSSSPFAVVARAYNGSIAFRYELPSTPNQVNQVISKEKTAFCFPSSFTLYQYNQESVFTPTLIDTFSKTSDFPTTLTFNNSVFVSVGEAENKNYTKAELKKGEKDNSLVLAFVKDASLRYSGAYHTPWRTISVSKTAIGLHAFSQLNLKLASPAGGVKVPEWIKPGKLIRAQLNTRSGLDCIDFAANHGLQYILFDAGWYGAEFRSSSDPTQVIPEIDMPKVIAYGKEKGIGIILYVNYVGLRARLDTLLPMYKNWGVAGLKFGFVDGLTQNGLSWLTDAIKKATGHGLVLNIHDNYKPTGLSRLYPALLTQEGIRGDENSPDAFHTTVLPFTRFLAGPADFTFCYPNPTNSYSKNIKVSKAQQLALTVIYFSPLQAMFWYGRPLDYTNEDEIEFFKYVPTVWNESHYLDGEIGKHISVARRHGDTWFVGNAAGLNDWQGKVTFDFLPKGARYTATIWEDGADSSLIKRTMVVKKEDSLPLNIKAKGGQVMMLSPVK